MVQELSMVSMVRGVLSLMVWEVVLGGVLVTFSHGNVARLRGLASP